MKYFVNISACLIMQHSTPEDTLWRNSRAQPGNWYSSSYSNVVQNSPKLEMLQGALR